MDIKIICRCSLFPSGRAKYLSAPLYNHVLVCGIKLQRCKQDTSENCLCKRCAVIATELLDAVCHWVLQLALHHLSPQLPSSVKHKNGTYFECINLFMYIGLICIKHSTRRHTHMRSFTFPINHLFNFLNVIVYKMKIRSFKNHCTKFIFFTSYIFFSFHWKYSSLRSWNISF